MISLLSLGLSADFLSATYASNGVLVGGQEDEEAQLFGSDSEGVASPSSRRSSVAASTSRIELKSKKPLIVVDEPDSETVESIMSSLYDGKGEPIEEMANYVVGIKGQERLLTLAEAYKAKLLTPSGAGIILHKVKGFKEGETSTLRLNFGFRRGEDLVIGRYPSSLIARPYGNEAFQPGDPSLGPMVKWLEILGHITWTQPLGFGPAAVTSNPALSYGYAYTLETLAAAINAQHFTEEHQRQLYGGANISPMNAGASAGTSNSQSSHGVWYSVMQGWQGLGYAGLYNLEEQQLGLSGLGVGTFFAGWTSYVQFGATLNAVFANGNQVGLGGVISLSKDRVTTYLHPYQNEYHTLIEGYIEQYQRQKKFLVDELAVTEQLWSMLLEVDNHPRVKVMAGECARINAEINKIEATIAGFLREKEFFSQKHFVEVIDTKSTGYRLQGGAFISGFAGGYRAGLTKGRRSIHRFYTPLERAKELLKDGNGEKLALLRLPEAFDKKGFPDLLRPQKWHNGEEVITTQERTFHGSIVMGVGFVPGFDAKVGLSGTVTGSFEIGVRKLPGNKLEVSIRPSEIREMGAFIATLSSFGPQISAASTVALAMRQSFIFDLDQQKAIDTYMLFMNAGILPLDFSSDEGIVGKREAENLLDVAIIARENLRKKGVLLTYLEKIDVPATKFYAGVGKIFLLKSSDWAGLSYEYLNGQAKVISTNGDIAVDRQTHMVQESKSQGRSGSSTEAAYATIKRIFVKGPRSSPQGKDAPDDSDDAYTWRFKGLVMRARFTDDKVTGNEQNEMIDKINTMFHANVQSFPKDSKPHKQSRDILLERELTSKDLDLFDGLRQSTIEAAAHASRLQKSELIALVSELEDKGHNQMANILENFIGTHGLKGVSAVHLLLNGSCRNLLIRTESNTYTDPVKRGNTLEAMHTKADMTTASVRFLDLNYDSLESKVNKVFSEVRETIAAIDLALAELEGDPLYEGPDDLLSFGDTNLREKKVQVRSKLLAAKSRLIDLIDLEKQEFPHETIVHIYSLIENGKTDVKQRYTLLAEKYKREISMHDSRKEITRRWIKVTELIDDIDKEIVALEDAEKQKILGLVFIEQKLAELHSIRDLSRRLIATAHLKHDAREFIKKMTKKTMGIFPAEPWHQRIAGYMQQSYL